MIKQLLAALVVICAMSTPAFAGGKGGTEIALASYNGIGGTFALGIPLDIKFLSANGIRTYGEVELGAGFGEGIAFGAELAGGLMIYAAPGISVYGSLGPALGVTSETDFGLGAELGVNIDVNQSSIIIEAGTHPASNYVAVGLRF